MKRECQKPGRAIVDERSLNFAANFSGEIRRIECRMIRTSSRENDPEKRVDTVSHALLSRTRLL